MRGLLLLCLCIASLIVQAQTESGESAIFSARVPGRWFVKTDPLLPVMPSHSVAQLGLEYNIDREYSLLVEAGFIYLLNWYQPIDDAYYRQGFRVRSGGRWYLSPINNGQYLQVDVTYKRLQIGRVTTFGYECENLACTWWRDHQYDEVRNKWAIHFRYGEQFILSDRWRIESYLGVGVATTHNDITGLPQDVTFENIRAIEAGFGDRTVITPSLLAGFSLVFQVN